MTDQAVEWSAFFTLPECDQDVFNRFADQAHASPQAREAFEEALAAYQERRGDDPLRAGVAALILGRNREALESLSKAPDSKYRHWYAAQAATALGRVEDAIRELQAAGARGWNSFETDLHVAALRLRTGDLAAASKLIDQHARVGGDRAEWYYASGLLSETQGDRAGALERYLKALHLNPSHIDSMFRAAWLHDLRGEDEEAIALYQRLALQPRAFVNALINLSVIYEDLGRYEEAAQCLRRVLGAYPNHTRARLFLKDVESSYGMVLDDGIEPVVDSRDRLLELPVTELDLSARARNSLKKMRVQTLGDLLQLGDTELLAYKNFGESTLSEIKVMLARRGLRLGQRPDEIDAAAIEVSAPRPVVPPGSEAVLAKPVSELELSVRARRCLQRLNIATVGDLISHTEAELLAIRNFGQTSMNEIRARLSELGLSLASKH
jgi:DNA-directed RNA polymerase subunit alpha